MTSTLIRTRRSNFLDDHHPSRSPYSIFTYFVTPILVHGRLFVSIRLIDRSSTSSNLSRSISCFSPYTRRAVVYTNEGKHVVSFYASSNECGSPLLSDPFRVGETASLNGPTSICRGGLLAQSIYTPMS